MAQPAFDGSGYVISASRSDAREDVLSLVCWSDALPLEQGLRRAQRCTAPQLGARRHPGIVVEVWYSQDQLARCELPVAGAHRLEIARHGGLHLQPEALRLLHGAVPDGWRVVLVAALRARTLLEESAGTWLVPSAAAPDLQPRVSELLELRQALLG